MRVCLLIPLILISGCVRTEYVPVPEPVEIEVQVPTPVPAHLLMPCHVPFERGTSYEDRLIALVEAVRAIKACNLDKQAIRELVEVTDESS